MVFCFTHDELVQQRADHQWTVHKVGPRIWQSFYGVGSLWCCSPRGRPLPTTRLGKFSHRLEDLVYVWLLESIVDRYEDRKNELDAVDLRWLMEARPACTVPQQLVKCASDYSGDAKLLYRWCDCIARLIESCF